MLSLELTGILSGIFIVFFSARGRPRPAAFLARMALVSGAGWITEESCIRLYHFYDYNPGWCLFLDQVPVLVMVIWPVMIISACDVASQSGLVDRRMVPLAGAAIIGSDALFIEPVAANAGLWNWHQSGIFSVPPIGILGWFFFALLCIRLLKDRRLQGPLSLLDFGVLLIPVMGTHLLLLLFWWGALRWINFYVDPLPAIVAVWCLSFFNVFLILKNRPGLFIQKKTVLIRIPAAIFFFILLFLSPGDPTLLIVYALAFVPPYITLMVQQYGFRTI